MFKVSFKYDYMKVQTFNDRATIVTMVGQMSFPTELWSVFPDKIANWMWQHPSVDASWSTNNKNLNMEVIRLEVSDKSVCAEEDTFNSIIGERIAESRAKIKMYKFMYTLIKMLCNYYGKLLLGYEYGSVTFNNDCLFAELDKYQAHLINESHHLGKLLEEA